MLTVNHLSKSFGKVHAVKDVSFHVKKGSTFAFLGTNGAGKSTVIHMIIDLLKPDAGTIKFTDGVLQDMTGVVFQSHCLDDELSIEENLLIRARLYGLNKKAAKKSVDDLLQLTNLFDKRKRLYGKCSGGEKRKADIIRALVHRPKILILDEPTTGLDAEAREEIWAMLQGLQEEQELTIFLTTHYIDEAENVDYVVIMHDGVIEVEGTPEELRTRYAKTILTLYTKNTDELKQLLDVHSYVVEVENKAVSITIESSKDAIPILQIVENSITGFSIQEASLERVFLQITDQIKRKVIS